VLFAQALPLPRQQPLCSGDAGFQVVGVVERGDVLGVELQVFPAGGLPVFRCSFEVDVDGSRGVPASD
jgi:hypothetical protein